MTNNSGSEQNLFPFSYFVVWACVALAFAGVLVGIAGTCLNWFPAAYPVLELLLLIIFSSWAAVAVAESDAHLFISLIILCSLASCFLYLVYYDAPIAFWFVALIFACYISSAALVGQKSIVHGFASFLVVCFFVITSGLIAAMFLLPSLYNKVNSDLRHIPLVDIRVALSAGFGLIALGSGIVKAFAYAANRPNSIWWQPSPMKVNAGNGIFAAFQAVASMLAWVISFVALSISYLVLRFLSSASLFFLQVGKEALDYPDTSSIPPQAPVMTA
jgi:hypothetical protein